MCWIVGILALFILGWIFCDRKETMVYPAEIPGHRPSLGDFLVTDSTPGVNDSGYEEEWAL